MKIKNIVVAGGGVLGSQIAFQAAYCGFNVTVWLRNQTSVNHAKQKINNLKKTYIETINLMDTNEGKNLHNWARGIADYDSFDKFTCLNNVQKAYDNIKMKTDLKESLINADLVIEALAEDIKIKNNFFEEIAPMLKQDTIIVTNSSSLLPSKMAMHTKRSDKFLALHFANSIWKNNTAEIMRHQGTSEESFNEVIEFAKAIKMIALPIRKEKAGYLLNSMLIPFLFSALDLYANEISDIESIDKAWTLGTGAPEGPFQILDIVGLNTAYNIVVMYTKIPSFLAPYNFKKMAKLLKVYIDNGKLGVSTGEGFYKYQVKEN
jgi:3-hydroxybutyryl-CoA dehydrogenase